MSRLRGMVLPASASSRALGYFTGRPPLDSSGITDVTNLLDAAAAGDRLAAAELLPLVYGELRRLAVSRMAGEAEGRTLQPTALVHEAYLRLVGPGDTRAIAP